MSAGYELVNYTRKEFISFSHLPASKARELAGNPVTAAITTWYLLHHIGDRIAFRSDMDYGWPFEEGSVGDVKNYNDVTVSVIDSLIDAGILVDDGEDIFWADEPDVYLRRLRNVWLS